jgi:CheY-like chemotaxis protein/archaellum biogenesis ATPase FlaH
MKILVVDDDNVTRRLFSDLLKNEGHNITIVESGYKAIEQFENSIFDLAIVDLKMPGIDGIEVLKELKAINPNTYVVIVTAYGTVDTAVEALKFGACDFIEKPFKLRKIQEIITDLAAQKQMSGDKSSIISRSMDCISKTGNCYELFQSSVEANNGLCISTQNINFLKEEYNLKNMPIIKLTANKIKDERGKKTIKRIKNEIINFIPSHPKSIILIDGFEFFTKYFSWNIIKDFLLEIYNELLKNNSKLLIYVNSNELEPKDIENLKKIICDVTVNIGLNCSSNTIEIDILEYLSTQGGATFNSIFKNLHIKQSSKLSFHLQKLSNEEIISKDNKRYFISPKGEVILRTLRYLNNLDDGNYQIPISMVYNTK